MAHAPPKPLPYGTARVLLIDWFQPTCDARARAMRERGIDVDAADNLDKARGFFQAGRYDLVLLDLHHFPAAEVLGFCRIIVSIDPNQRLALLVGAPSYITLDWQKELASPGAPSQHLQRKAKRHTAAA
jgi:ActR/RegA family two-component response regulator